MMGERVAYSSSSIGRSIRRLLLCLSCNLTLNNICSPLPLKLHLRSFGLNIFAKLDISGLGGSLCFDLCLLHFHLQLCLSHRVRGLSTRLLLFPLRLCNCCICFNLGDVLGCKTLLFLLTDFTSHAGFGYVDLGLVEGPLMSLAREKGKVLRAGGVL